MTRDSRPVVTFLGPEGSYTHQAAQDAFSTSEYSIQPQVTIEDVFTSVQTGAAFRGVVPFENSSNGSVTFTLDLFANLRNEHPDILVCGESYIAVKHCLVGYAPRQETMAAPTSPQQADVMTPFPQVGRPMCDLSGIKRLYSHPQAWGQCKAFLNMYLQEAERHDVSSTSQAADLVSHDPSGQSAALSSRIAASLFGLDLLAHTINDHVNNTTRFLVLRRKDGSAPHASIPGSPSSAAADVLLGPNGKSLVTFTVHHASPGALAQCLAAFARFGLNLTSISTRPSGAENWHYVFFVELKGRKGGSEHGSLRGALQELGKACSGYRWLGSWENRLDEGS